MQITADMAERMNRDAREATNKPPTQFADLSERQQLDSAREREALIERLRNPLIAAPIDFGLSPVAQEITKQFMDKMREGRHQEALSQLGERLEGLDKRQTRALLSELSERLNNEGLITKDQRDMILGILDRFDRGELDIRELKGLIFTLAHGAANTDLERKLDRTRRGLSDSGQSRSYDDPATRPETDVKLEFFKELLNRPDVIKYIYGEERKPTLAEILQRYAEELQRAEEREKTGREQSPMWVDLYGPLYGGRSGQEGFITVYESAREVIRAHISTEETRTRVTEPV